MTRRMWVWRDGKMLEVDLSWRPAKESVAPAIRTSWTKPRYCHATGTYHNSPMERDHEMKMRGVSVADKNSFLRQGPEKDDTPEIIDEILETKRALEWGEIKPASAPDEQLQMDEEAPVRAVIK